MHEPDEELLEIEDNSIGQQVGGIVGISLNEAPTHDNLGDNDEHHLIS